MKVANEFGDVKEGSSRGLIKGTVPTFVWRDSRLSQVAWSVNHTQRVY
jgi:hypothetical protein